ncbi:hypothetical protein [Streptomyces hokutonensis]|uniref:Uncharacterized protein n=1 Tax=Streptomyces hokutonensis TaxID=1306990 RepID=A0ABW6M667_9ACTN
MPTPSAEITLTTSRALGLVAIASGEEYQRAHRAVKDAGFRRLSNGVFVSPLADAWSARYAASSLVHHAHEHGATITPSPRPYLGDIGTEIAARLPGAWSAQLEIYSHPVWQEDLWPALWEAGDLYRALVEHRIPFASVLKNDTGTELLLVERPGHRSGYLLGALTEQEKEDPHDDPATPPSIVLPADPELAAHAVTHTFLPAYRRALHHRDLNTVLRSLERIREEHQTLQAVKDSGRYSDGVPLGDSRVIAGMERDFADRAWLSFTDVLDHGPLLLARCRPTATPWPQDAAALTRLREALAHSQDAWNEWNDTRRDLYAIPRTVPAHEWSQIRGRLGLAVLPAIETWLAYGDTFERQARAAVPGGPAALSASSPRLLTTRPAPPPTPRPPRRTAERTDKDPSLSGHFRFTSHPEHGYVAEADPRIPGHLADWLLTREQFEPIPGASGRYRLTHTHHDGPRRTRQAAQDLRRLGYQVHTAATLTRTPGSPQPGVNNGLLEGRARIAQAAATRSPQSPAAPATSLPEVMPQTAAVAVGGRARATGGGQGR